MARIKWEDNVSEKLLNAAIKKEIAIRMLAQEGAKTFETYAKQNRRWRDRTGHARQRLLGYIEHSGDVVRIYISHGVEYGKWLELAHEKRYAILMETVNNNSEKVIESFKNFLQEILS